MLIFDYQCTSCFTIEEHYVKKHDDIPQCTVCASPMSKRSPVVGMLKTNFANKTKL